MRDIFEAGKVTLLIDELGRRVWVCTEKEGTVLRLGRIDELTIEDRRQELRENEQEARDG